MTENRMNIMYVPLLGQLNSRFKGLKSICDFNGGLELIGKRNCGL